MKRMFVAVLSLLLGAAVQAEPVWIDVRSATEFARGHLPEAHNIPLHEVAVRIRDITVDADADVRLYCGIGVRAQVAKLQLESAGYRNVTNEGGYADILARRKASPPQAVECQNRNPTQRKQEGPC